MVRAFVGLTVPDDVKSYISGLQRAMQQFPIKAKFVEQENIHISLSFLGEVNDPELEEIKSKLDNISKSYEKFKITIDSILLIPNRNFIRVVALDVKSDILESLRKEIVKSLDGKSHSAHLTLARVSSIDDKKKFIENVNIAYPSLTFDIDGICLIKSELRKSGPVYTILHKSHLK